MVNPRLSLGSGPFLVSGSGGPPTRLPSISCTRNTLACSRQTAAGSAGDHLETSSLKPEGRGLNKQPDTEVRHSCRFLEESVHQRERVKEGAGFLELQPNTATGTEFLRSRAMWPQEGLRVGSEGLCLSSLLCHQLTWAPPAHLQTAEADAKSH